MTAFIFMLALGTLLVYSGSAKAPSAIDVVRPVSIGLYGSGIAADSLNNTQVGGRFDSQVAYRFRSTQSSALQSVGVYIVGPEKSGYGGGTGGTIQVSVRPDDGTLDHFPTNTILSSVDVVGPVSGANNVYAFPSPAMLENGRLYHIVFTNVDPEPTVNFVSVDGLFVYDEQTIWQPAFLNTDWANLFRVDDGSWTAMRGTGEGTTTPILQLNYASGVSSGMGYIEVWSDAAKEISGNYRVREAFTVTGNDRQVSSVSLRLARISGSQPLMVALESADGTQLWEGTIPASAFPLGDKNSGGSTRWATLELPGAFRLVAGRSYRLVLSSEQETTYSIFPVREGIAYGYAESTVFADGSAQFDDGSGWAAFHPSWRGPLDQSDLQFYFR